MLLEIIKSRPLFVVLWATISETFVLLTVTVFWLDLVNALLMPLEVIDGCETLRSLTTRFSTDMLFVVSSRMFPVMAISTDLCQRVPGRLT